jgi:hypothetical protein
VTQGHDPGQSGADLAQARARIEQLTADLAAERTARQVAEAKVALMAQNLDDLRFSLRAISGPPQGAEATAATAPAAPSSVQVPAAAAVPLSHSPAGVSGLGFGAAEAYAEVLWIGAAVQRAARRSVSVAMRRLSGARGRLGRGRGRR